MNAQIIYLLIWNDNYNKEGNIIHFFDIKTGSAKLSNDQILKIQRHSGFTVPVTEIKIP